jgi:acetylornithine deacetylase/succinyl-diaminopimelate desuccinylase-like protein
MDKQPPFTGWREGLSPYNPVMVGDKLYGRGGADDGYSVFGTILAIKACQHFGLQHPRIVMLFEADEESGSEHIHHYLTQLRPRIGRVDLVICLDSGCGNYEQIWETSTLRGFCLC